MADYELLKQIAASKAAKMQAVAGTTKRFEQPCDKATRLSEGVPYYMAPDTRPKDEHVPQTLGDPNNRQASGYRSDVPDSDWLSAPKEDGTRRPGFTGSEDVAAHAVGRATAKSLPKDPATVGRGARRR